MKEASVLIPSPCFSSTIGYNTRLPCINSDSTLSKMLFTKQNSKAQKRETPNTAAHGCQSSSLRSGESRGVFEAWLTREIRDSIRDLSAE